MATLAEQRRATGESVSRLFDSGKSAAKERRAIGNRIEAERRGTAVVEDINRLQQPAPVRRTLRPVQPLGSLPASRGTGVYRPPPATPGGGGGIASPLTEQSYAAREYWPGGLPSTDGLLMLPAEKRVVMTDANGAQVIFDYAEPS